MRHLEWSPTLRLVEGGLAALALVGLVGLSACSEPGAMTNDPEADLLVTQALTRTETVASRSFMIRELRLGHGLDVDRKVPTSLSTSRFAAGDPIKMSVWVAAAPAGSTIRVSVLDTSARMVWNKDDEAPADGSYLAYDLGRQLPRGRYQVEVKVDHDLAGSTRFDVVDRADRDRR